MNWSRCNWFTGDDLTTADAQISLSCLVVERFTRESTCRQKSSVSNKPFVMTLLVKTERLRIEIDFTLEYTTGEGTWLT